MVSPHSVSRRAAPTKPHEDIAPRRPLWWVVALLVVGGLLAWYWQGSRNQRLYAAYFESQPRYAYTSVRSLGEDPAAQVLQAALTTHAQGRYDKAATLWQAYLQTEVDNLDYRPHLYLAVAQMEMGRLAEAEANIHELPADLSSELAEEAGWYRALLALRQEKEAAAREALHELAEKGNSLYSRRAQNLLDEL